MLRNAELATTAPDGRPRNENNILRASEQNNMMAGSGNAGLSFPNTTAMMEDDEEMVD